MDIIHALSFLSEPVPRLIRMLVSDWAQKMCLCPIGGQNLSRWFRDLLIQKSSHANSTVCCTASVGELWREFSVKMEPKKPRNSILKQHVAMFTNLASISPQSDFFNWCIFHWKLKTLLEKSSPTGARQVQAKSRVCSWTPSHKKIMVSDWAQIYFLCPVRDKRSNESWNWFVKSTIPGALSPVLEKFLLLFFPT